LIVDDDVLAQVVKGAIKRETGARGLRAALVPHLEEAAFEAFGVPGGRVRLVRRQDGIRIERG
jgi:ATP-dependent Clp protease ATP-binding subunit ClpX